MIHRVPTAREQLDFIQKMRRLLDEGSFVATYKFALLHAMADLCVTQGEDSGGPLTLSTRDLADQFIRLYWRQAAPFPAGDTEDPLRQNTGRQAAVVNAVREARAAYDDHLGKVEKGKEWPSSVTSCSAPPGATSPGTGRFWRMSSMDGASTVTGA